MSTHNSYRTLESFTFAGASHRCHSLRVFGQKHDIRSLPYSLKILLENLLRREDGITVHKDSIDQLAAWDAAATPSSEIQFMPARVLLQDFTGVPCIADLAAMRNAVRRLGGDVRKVNPLQPADLVIDHSIQVDAYGTADALNINLACEFDRNRERYEFLRWGQDAFRNFRVVPPATGIVHQVNLEYLSQVAMTAVLNGEPWIYPDTLVGTDSHTTMINGLGVLGWGVGGIEAEAALLGQPCCMLIPQVVGMRMSGRLPATATATDLVLTVTQILRKKGVVGKFVEFFGPGIATLTLADRAIVSNMAPEYGATVGLFPVDEQTTAYLRLTGRADRAALVEAYFREQGLWYQPDAAPVRYSEILELDLGKVEPALAGPSRPQDRVPLHSVRKTFRQFLSGHLKHHQAAPDAPAVTAWIGEGGESATGMPVELLPVHPDCHLGPYGATAPAEHPAGNTYQLCHGSVVIAAITSCTNTSNPDVMIAAGLLARNAVEKGLRSRPWVKTSLAPGSQVVMDYLKQAGLIPYLEALGFHLVGFGCTTCIGNSGPLPKPIAAAITKGGLAVASVLSGNRNFEGRIHTQVRANYLASPPLVVAFALTGNMNTDVTVSPLGTDPSGRPVYLRDIWPTPQDVEAVKARCIGPELFVKSYADVFHGPEAWRALAVPSGELYAWNTASTYIREPPFLKDAGREPTPPTDIRGARVLALLGDMITTDHISPAGQIGASTPAGRYLASLGIKPEDFNSYGARRGNHEVMVRGTFANVQLKNLLAPGTEGGVTRYQPGGEAMSIFEASERYRAAGTPLLIIAGKEYGAGSSRDWAAKGPQLLGVRAVLAEGYERIHRSNLIGMGILPLQFMPGETAASLGLSGQEAFDIAGLASLAPGATLSVAVAAAGKPVRTIKVLSRIDTPIEIEYFRHGGILPYVLRQLLKP